MTKRILIFSLPLFLFSFCEKPSAKSPPDAPLHTSEQPSATRSVTDSAGLRIAQRFPAPPGFERVLAAPNSFGEYLRNLPLLPGNGPVLLFDGREKGRQDVHAAVIDLDVGTRDLQQCADAVMRLRAEHLFAQKKYADIGFHFVSGFPAEYAKWRAGNRIFVSGNKVSWQATNSESTSYGSFRKYLDVVFSYASTLSLAKEMRAVDLEKMEIGDVFIQGGSPGHAVIVVDMAVNPATGEQLFLLAQSYMPAQQIHVLKNENDPSLSPWYRLDFGENLQSPEWEFSKGDLKRF